MDECQGGKGPNWEVYRDALAPIRSKPLPRPWERAPVSAHAPRLQGRQIWKKAGIRSQANKENDLSHEELEREGTGARKRHRVAGTKENIADALWSTNPGKPIHDEQDQEKVEGEQAGILKDLLSFVPRKRTNTNHVITPRKPLRQTTLNGQAQTQILSQDMDDTMEKPARRRKSMRKSMRVSSAAATSELVLAATVTQDVQMPEPASQEETGSPASNIEEHPPTIRRSSRKSIASDAPQPTPGAASPAPSQNLREDELPAPREDEVEIRLLQELEQEVDLCNTTTEVVKIPLNDRKDEGPHIELHTPSIKEMEMEETVKIPAVSVEAEPHFQPSIEDNIDTGTSQSLKSTGTPKKRKGQEARHGTRRSIRTRASSAKAEERPDQRVAAHNEAGLSLVDLEHGVPPQDVSPMPVDAPLAPSALVNPSVPAEAAATGLPNDAPVMEGLSTSTEAELIKAAQDIIPNSHALSFELAPISNHGTLRPDSQEPERLNDPPESTGDEIVPAESLASPGSPRDPISPADLDEEALPESGPVPDVDAGSPLGGIPSENSSPVHFSPASDREVSPSLSDEQTMEILETIEPIFVPADQTLSFKMPNNPAAEPPETSTPDPTTSALVEAISENAPSVTYDHDDTDMLRNFLTRVKANKAAKAQKTIPKRKRSLPHSPLQLPLGGVDNGNSPSPQKEKDEFDISLAVPSPSNKRRKRNEPAMDDEEETQPKSIRRSGRTRLPVVKSPLAAPSFIPVRRLGQDADTTVTLKRSEEKELAALTRVNTRKNKGGALSAAAVLTKKAEEKDDPALRQRLLKEVFNEKAQKNAKDKKPKSVAWAVEIAQFQEAGGRKRDTQRVDKEKDKEKVIDERKGALRVGIKSKVPVGVALGTPTPKRKTRERV